MSRVLIVEDEYIIAFSLRAQLEREGHEVVGIARDGLEAVELSQRHAPEVVLMDLRLPRLDGVAATKRIMQQQCTTVLLVSAAPQEELEAAVAASGAKGYLRKPFTPVELTTGLAAAKEDPAVRRGFSQSLATGSGCGEEGAGGPGGEGRERRER